MLQSHHTISRLALGAVCLALGLVGACSPSDSQAAADEPRTRVIATIGMIGDVARIIAGDRAEVGVLMAPGVDPHLFTPTRTDVGRLLDADIILYNGLQLEGRLTDALERARESGKAVIAVAEGVPADERLTDEASKLDPHVWMDPTLWIHAADAIEGALAEADPDGATTFATNAAKLKNRFQRAHDDAVTALERVPESHRVLITAHDAFEYFGRRYAFEVHGVQGLSTESEAGLRDVEALVDLIVDRGVTAVFVESTVADRGVQALIAGAAAKGHSVALGGELYSDALGPEGSGADTYLGMFEHNVRTIANALGASGSDG